MATVSFIMGLKDKNCKGYSHHGSHDLWGSNSPMAATVLLPLPITMQFFILSSIVVCVKPSLHTVPARVGPLLATWKLETRQLAFHGLLELDAHIPESAHTSKIQ
jgi:hypothetical protein